MLKNKVSHHTGFGQLAGLPSIPCSIYIPNEPQGQEVSAGEWEKRARCGQGRGRKERRKVRLAWSKQAENHFWNEDSVEEGLWALMAFSRLKLLLLLAKIHRQSACLIPTSELAHAQRESLLFLFVINSASRDLSTEHKSSALLWSTWKSKDSVW